MEYKYFKHAFKGIWNTMNDEPLIMGIVIVSVMLICLTSLALQS